jgi:drug/metabolite transporter (DMT)-like permease
VVYLVGVAAALSLGLGYVLQQRAAVLAPLDEVLSWRLLLDLLHKKVWLWGVGCMVVGQLLGGLALQLASVAVVEPLLSANLLFAFVIAAGLSDRRVRWHEVGGAVLLSLSLGAFLLVGQPKSNKHPDSDTLGSVIALIAVVAAVAIIVVFVAKKQQFIAQAVLLSTGAGLLYGLQDTATRQALLRADDDGIARIFTSPATYLVVAAAVTGLLLAQSAFKIGALSHSLPPLTAAEPLAGIALGVSLLGDRVAVTPGRLAVEAACGAGVIFGVYLIGRSPTLNRPHRVRRHRTEPPHPQPPPA